ncbi:MmgE/PrpD family protein [Halomonas salipaludis]|uniref:2-methylcitrate dehydratase n=1 Tax=Halomonas salipaludis TaxID=2032625 RepID=A0A2A2ESX2_9GAMM|nr:MmgE/PrpD family protein [Halomonas salipaludis]PAU75574.1 2-methylcitrate dehydratase [Halomonas salipaludis]
MLLQEIATRSRAITFEACPIEALETAKLAILDTIGVTLAGADADSTSTVLKASQRALADGPALLFGSHRRVDVYHAALINGTASHALDFDDCSNTLGGHPSAPIVPALWALAEERGASGADLLSAYIAGVEVETKIGRAVNFHHYEKGWHPTATLGTFGSAAACSHLLGLPIERTTHALSLAVSMSAGVKANFGTMTKPYHVGQSARNGLLAALLAEAGMTANPEALEHPQGFFAIYNGTENCVPGRILDTWAKPLDIVEPGIAFKRHPCCASTHPAVDAILQLRKEHGLLPEDVAHVRSWTHPRRLNHTNRPDPQTGLDGKFSVQYVIARALMHGIVSLEHFSDDAVNEAPVRDLLARIHAEPHPGAIWESTEHFFAEVAVTTHDGRYLKAKIDRPLGRDRHHPLPKGTLERKFLDCASRVLTPNNAEQLSEQLLQLDRVNDTRTLSQLIIDGSVA